MILIETLTAASSFTDAGGVPISGFDQTRVVSLIRAALPDG